MALYAPAPFLPAVNHSPSSSSSSSPSSDTNRPLPSTRHISQSERMLLSALHRADRHRYHHHSVSSHLDTDYFSPASGVEGGIVRSKSTSSALAAARQTTPKKISPTHLIPVAHHHHSRIHSTDSVSRSPSPAAQRVVDRERAARRRTPSPSPHPYRPASPRTLAPPHLSRHQTAPVAHASSSTVSRPVTPSLEQQQQIQVQTSSPSPVRPYGGSRHHSRRESGSGVSPCSSYSKQMSAHEQYLRARLEGVLAASTPRVQQQEYQAMDVSSSPLAHKTKTLSRGPSVSRTAPPLLGGGAGQATASGDQWNWTNASAPAMYLANPSAQTSPPTQNSKLTTRSPSSSQLPMLASPTRSTRNVSAAMITPPPSPPYRGTAGAPNLASASTATSNAPSRAPSQGRSGLGHGHPSRASSRPPPPSTPEEEESVTPPFHPQAVFDARSASLALKNQHGYVSFCEVAGLGEPEGMFDDEKDEDADAREEERRGRWWEVWRK